MPMGRKHYEAVAKVLCESYKQVDSTQASHRGCTEVLDSTVGELVQVFKNDNPRFDKEKFIEAINRCVMKR